MLWWMRQVHCNKSSVKETGLHFEIILQCFTWNFDEISNFFFAKF